MDTQIDVNFKAKRWGKLRSLGTPCHGAINKAIKTPKCDCTIQKKRYTHTVLSSRAKC